MAYLNLKQMAAESFEHIEKKEFELAEQKLTYLLNVYPDDPTLLYYLGGLYLKRKQYGFAVMAYEKAIKIKPSFDEAMNNAADAYRKMGNIDECIAMFEAAKKVSEYSNFSEKYTDALDARKARANYIANLGACYVATGNPHKALGYLNQALKLWPELPNGMWNWGLAKLELGDFEKGFEGYEYGDRVTSTEKDRSYHGSPNSTSKWDGVPDKNKTVVVHGEQGIGDEIMFASILPDIMNDVNVILECHPRLIDLFRGSFPGLTVYGTRKAKEVNWAKNYQIDAKIAIGSLAHLYRKKESDFPGTPYIKANKVYQDNMRQKLDSLSGKPKIGISWKGGVGSTNKASY